MIMSIDTIFKVLNFGLVVAVIGYLVRRYGVPYIVSSMKAEQQEQKSLEVKLQDIENLVKEIENAIKQQEQEYQAMQDRFSSWQKIVADKQEQDQVAMQERAKQIELQNVQKIKSLQVRRLMKQQMPLVVDNAEKKLQQELEQDSAKRKEYVMALVSFLKK